MFMSITVDLLAIGESQQSEFGMNDNNQIQIMNNILSIINFKEHEWTEKMSAMPHQICNFNGITPNSTLLAKGKEEKVFHQQLQYQSLIMI